MTLPTFLGIGVPRAGTTWLHTMLTNHPEVYMPTLRKEIRFFERYYERGIAYYETFFPPREQAEKYQAIGEISTQYYNCRECPERIFNTLPEVKLIVMLRHPVDRAYSHYGFVIQRRNFRGSFEDFLATRPSALEKGFYSRYLKQYLRYFERNQILALLFEDVFADTFKAQNTIANFLGIDVNKYLSSTKNNKVNASSIPAHQSLYGLVVKTGRKLRRWNLEPVVDLIKRQGIDSILSKGKRLPPIKADLKKELSQSYMDEFEELEKCLQIDLGRWIQPEMSRE